MRRRFLLVLLFCLMISALAGCAENIPARYPVKGTVKWNNKPVEGATVKFYLKESSWVVTAVTDAQGNYEEQAYVGANRVAVTKTKKEERPNAAGKNELRSVHVIPGVYSTPSQSKLKTTIEATEVNTYNIDLKGTVVGESD